MRRKLIYVISLVLASALFQVTTVYGFNPNTDPSLVGWWKFDETSGTTAADSSHNGNDGAIRGNPQWVSGYIGGALSFDGNGDYVDCRNGPTLTIQSGITMACWIKVPAFTRQWATIISRGDDSFRISRGESTNSLHMGVFGTSTTGDPWFDGFKKVDDDQWHHVAGVYDGTRATLYIDGVVDAYIEATGLINASTFNLYIGENSQATGRYWNGLIDDVRLYNRGLTLDELSLVRKGFSPTIAELPNPRDGAKDVVRDVVLGWQPCEFAVKHNVYFGTDFNDVNAATTTNYQNYPNVQVSLNQDANTYDPIGLLELDRTYYWRIDEVNDAHPEKLWTGTVWSFTAELVAYPISNIIATASSSLSETMKLEKTVDGSGINASDQHSTEVTDMWLSSSTGPQPTLMEYDFGKTYKLRELLVWNYNSDAEPSVGLGVKNVTIQYSSDGINWPQLSGVPDFNQATGLPDYTYNTTINFGDIEAKYVRITANSNWGELFQQYGLSEVRFLSIPVHAREPSPTNGQTNVALDTVLRWRAGREVATHKLYISTNEQAVRDGPSGPITPKSIPVSGSMASYAPAPSFLELGKTYYWKIDEVNNTTTWDGDIWSFTTTNYLIVDDMESYGESNASGKPGSRIWYTWNDGYGWKDPLPGYHGNGSGAFVDVNGTIARNSQSLRLDYNNDGSFTNIFNEPSNPYYSKVERTFESPQNWSTVGIKSLSLYFYGDPNNNRNVPMWMKLTDQSNHSGKVKYGTYADEDANNLVGPLSWHEWNINLADFGGVDLAKITKLAVGIGNEAGTVPAGSGTVYLDDIRLYAARCLVSRLKSTGDLNNDCTIDYLDVNALANAWMMSDRMIPTTIPAATGLVGHWKFDEGSGTVAADSSGKNFNGTITGTPKWVTGQIGGGLEFDGTNDYVGSAFTLASSNTVTMTAWIKRKGDQTVWTGLVFHRRGTGGSTVTCGMGFSGVAGRTNQLQYHWNYNSAATYNFESGLVVPDNEWSFVSLVIEPTKATLYLNGLSATNAIAHQKQSVTETGLNLGRDPAGRYFRGLMDDVRVYSRVLSAAEIAYLADVSPGDGKLHIPVQSIAELYFAEPEGSQKVDLKDFAKLAQGWLEEILWP